MCFTKDQLSRLVNKALLLVRQKDQELLDCDASERAITHRLAFYVEQILRASPEYNEICVDVEYNRKGEASKKLVGVQPRKPRKRQTDDVSAFPDLIIHKRGEDGPNYLVVEVKKVGADKDEIDYDAQKLRVYLEGFSYHFAAHLFIECKGRGGSNAQNPQPDGKSEGLFFCDPSSLAIAAPAT